MPSEKQILETFERVSSEMVTPTTFIYLAADRASSNLAIVRNAVNKHAAALV